MDKGIAYDKFEQANLKFEQKSYQSALDRFKDCIQAISEVDAIELLPKVLQKVAICCENVGDIKQAKMFKNFEKQYYETVLMRHSLDMIDEEKENFKKIQDRAAELEGLARLCDENDCAKLAMDYMTKATLIRRNKMGRNNLETQRSLDLFADYVGKAGSAQYKENVEKVRKSNPDIFQKVPSSENVRRRTSILKSRKTSVQNSQTSAETGPKKKVHFSSVLPKYTDEKKRRTIWKQVQFVILLILVQLATPLILPVHLSHLLVQFKVVIVLLGVIIITR